MLSRLRRTMGRTDTKEMPDGTKDIARERLQKAINRDRYDMLEPDVKDNLRRDLLAAISRHLEVGDEFQELEIRRLNQSFYLVASVRIQGIPRWAAVS